MRLFVPITKVDAQTREVWGRAAQEVPDRASEVFDYASSKPHFEKWSGDIEKATGGKSLGNVRAMHNAVAAGKVTAIQFDDDAKAIDVGTKIVDAAEFEKCVEGVYTGFSIGGKYAKRWRDAADQTLTRYTAAPHEISLVDLPCIPTATFALVKADGAEEARTFKIAARNDTKPEEGEHKYGDVAFADPRNKKYPIDSAKHIRAAWSYINHPDNAGKYSAADAKRIKAKIIAAWKKKIDPKGPPSAEKMAKRAAAVATLADALERMQALQDDGAFEALEKRDDAEQSDAVRAWLEKGDALLTDMVEEESAELVGDSADDSPEDDPMTDAEKIAADAALAKVTAERDALQKQIADRDAAAKADDMQKAADALAKVTSERDALEKRVAELEKEPATPKGALLTVEKGTEMTTAAPEMEKLDPADPEYSFKLMKRAQKETRRVIAQ